MSATQLTVKVPKGLAGGDKMQVEHAGHLFNVTVPPGLAPGDDFIVAVPVAPPPAAPPPGYGEGGAGGMPAGVVLGQPAHGPPNGAFAGPTPFGTPPDPCRGCGRQFVRRPGVRPNTAQWYRCEECEGNITFCSLM
ncbi:hypothetical protein KFE25_005275 [Diacronema lutheri]|uniref:Uncharacterized protein n=1 Tax=Diacronema lutheri TaxID=2081491 RepID=A0A8J5X8X5_DIALT|nr:hypothetical protein KFE25_005275 [Diacronema lutheri]